MNQLVEHIIAFSRKQFAYRLIILRLDGRYHLINGLHERLGLSHLNSMSSHTHISHSSLQGSLSLFLLRFVASIHDNGGLLIFNSIEDVHDLLQFRILTHLAFELILILDIKLVRGSSRAHLHFHDTILGREDIWVVHAIPIMEVKTGHRLILIGKQQTDILSLHLGYFTLDLAQNVTNLLRNPHGHGELHTILREFHLARILETLQ